MNSQLYPQGPGSVPHDLTAPGNKYKRHVWIASLAILLFVVFYFSLSSWFLYTSYRLFANAFSDGRDGFLSFIGGTLMGFLGIFMFKAIFFFTSNDKSDDIEISREEEPELFEFIYKLADEARAPRPHKIFLSNRVNASVFYDLSIINLIFPSRKNLEIGLGLINVLNLGEFKSILAHEFGHFTQRSMIIGRWVYIAHQIAYQIVAKRDFLDRFLAGLSSVDLRVAWIGWLLSLIVWSIRSFAEVFFKLVLLTQRALSREMEFHADLVAVSLTGSDALIHSLYKLGAADSAYDDALRFVNKQLEKNKATADIYAIQENSIKQMAIVLNNPVYGLSPKMPEGKRSDFRVFKEQIAQPPKMWSTHPANTDRENNAKKIYIPAEIDERSAWILFKDPDKIKNRLTLELYKTLTIETTSLAREESLAEHNKEFQSSFLLPRYRGVYLNRKITEAYSSSAEIYSMSINPADLPKKLSLLYPASLQEELERLKNLDEEILMLEGLKNKVLDANEGKIKYRGEEIKRSQLPEVIERVRNEAKAERDKINEHDKLCRNVHYAIARSIGQGWDKYIFSLTSLIHYCEHNQSNIEEQSRFFYDTLAVVSGMKNVNSSELNQLLTAASELHLAMKKVFVSSKGLALTPVIVSKLDGKSLSEMLGEFELAGANEGNINSWISVLPSWLQLTLNSLSDLRAAVLDELLNTEDYVAKLAGAKPEAVKPAPEPLFIPTGYPLSGSSEKRELIKDTGVWSRFQNSEGIFPTIARLTVAASIIIAAVGFGGNIGSSRVVIYNGLSIPVIVSV
ncbi:MAG: M48 family metalloprotease, partial [Cytophagaceae bacterium]